MVVEQHACRPGRGHDKQCQHHDHRGMPEGEPEPHRLGSGAVGCQLASDIVDGGDVVGIEGVSQAQHVGGDTEADGKHLRANLVPLGRHHQDQRAEADRVQRRNHTDESTDLCPVSTIPGDNRPWRHATSAWGLRVPVVVTSDGRVWLPTSSRWPETGWTQWRDRTGISPVSAPSELNGSTIPRRVSQGCELVEEAVQQRRRSANVSEHRRAGPVGIAGQDRLDDGVVLIIGVRDIAA